MDFLTLLMVDTLMHSKFISTSDDGHMRAFCCGNAVTGGFRKDLPMDCRQIFDELDCQFIFDKMDFQTMDFQQIFATGIGDVVVYKPPGRSQ